MTRPISGFSKYVSRCFSDEKIDSIARESGFLKRRSAISPKAFLDSLFFCNQGISPTLTQYAIDLQKNGAKSVSKQAVDKRFNGDTEKMLITFLAHLMQKNWAGSLPQTDQKKHFSQIRVMDSTEFLVSKKVAGKYPGYGGKGREAMVKIQLEYELNQNQITRFSIGSALDADAKAGMEEIEKVPAKTLLIRDLGYCSPKAFKTESGHDLYFISRAKPQWSLFVKDENGELIKLTCDQIIEKLRHQKEKYLDIEVIAGAAARTPVRLIACLLNENQINARIKRKRNRDGTRLSAEQEKLACLSLFVTNVEREKCDAASIYQFYSLRWQIELIFKTLKSILNLHLLHAMNATRLTCVLLIRLMWIMLNWHILNSIQQATNLKISFHKLCRTLVSRSVKLTMTMLQSKEKLQKWLADLACLSKRFHEKEYKKGTEDILKILNAIH